MSRRSHGCGGGITASAASGAGSPGQSRFKASSVLPRLRPLSLAGVCALSMDRAGTALVGRFRSFLLAVAVVLMLLATPAHAAEDSPERQFASSALALRAAVVAGEERALDVLAAMPGAGMAARETLPALWSPSFANAIVKLGRLRSDGPTALYYDPLLDIAVLTLWTRGEEGYRVAAVRALPGARLAEPGAAIRVEPAWLSAQDGAVGALSRTTTARLDAFRLAHPADATGPGLDTTPFATAAADLRAALPRLAWGLAQRAQWADEAKPWLRPVLVEVEEALAARDPAALTAAAPDTDADTAAALVSLPAGFVEGLELDMVIEAAGQDRLLIGSQAADGDTYVLALCGLDAGACALHRLMLVSLLE